MSRTPLPAPPPHPPQVLAAVDAMLDGSYDPIVAAASVTPEMAAARAAREAEQRATDWAMLARYRDANRIVRSPDLVMIGDSGTEIWAHALPDRFDADRVGRGIAGQTSGQILLRFVPDAVALRPRRIHLLCGTNDIAGNAGPCLPEDYQRNMTAMADLAAANSIDLLIGSLTPAATIFWSPDAEPLVWTPVLNAWLRDFTAARGLRFIDYHALLTDGAGGLKPEYSGDGVHVTRVAYLAMEELLERALAER